MTTPEHESHRRLDLAGLTLMLLGLLCSLLSYWLISVQHLNALVIAPSIVAITLGATHLTKWELRRK